jgi:hypothetical protein
MHNSLLPEGVDYHRQDRPIFSTFLVIRKMIGKYWGDWRYYLNRDKKRRNKTQSPKESLSNYDRKNKIYHT